jgi:rhamnosyltransferase
MQREQLKLLPFLFDYITTRDNIIIIQPNMVFWLLGFYREITMKNVCGVTVLYNADNTVIDNIESYIYELDQLFVVDNSEPVDKSLVDNLKALPNCTYISNNGNQGIANALNVGAKLATEAGATWLLTMDQDSKFEPRQFSQLIEYTTKLDDKITGLVSPFHKTKIAIEPKTEIDEVLTTMTSGNLISLYAWKAIGGFDEDYFIDAVDWDYCLRLTSGNFKVLRLNTVHLEHNLGNATQHTSPTGKQITALNYNKIRRYYITRNKLIIIAKYWKSYPGFSKGVFKSLFRDLRHILLYESDKMVKLKYLLIGASHFIIGKKGKLPN